MRRLPRVYVYLLFSREGRTYTGVTNDIRRRLSEHNAPTNSGWTRGQRWSILAVRAYLDRHSALLVEERLKAWRPWWQRNFERDPWIRQARPRLRELCRRHGIPHHLT